MIRNNIFPEKNAFFLDSYFFAIVVVILLCLIGYSITSWGILGLLIVYVALGYASWSIFEYSLHRWLLHGPLIRHHWQHHVDQFVGSPSYISIGAFPMLFGFLWIFFSIAVVASLSLGFVFGYLYYLYIHYLDHHKIIYPNQFLYEICEHHARHHYYAGGNYGTTTRLWDWLLKTSL